MTTRRERRERRSLARREWANKRNAKADDALDRAEKAVEGIPPGQPILAGHHSEATHRRALDRHDSAMRKGREHAAMALKHDSAADALENELSRSVYSDDPDAAERLKERIDGLLAKRARMHQVNRQFRKTGSLEGLDITEEERQDLVNAARFSGSKGYPSYEFDNLSGNLSRLRKRLSLLQGESFAAAQMPSHPDSPLATAPAAAVEAVPASAGQYDEWEAGGPPA